MKTYALYGLAISIGGAALMLVLYLLGFHSDPDKFIFGVMIGIAAGLTIAAIGLVLAMRARRAAAGPAGFSYGAAFRTGFMTGLFAALFGLVFNYAYFAHINPSYSETMVQWGVNMMEKSGAPQDKIDKFEEKMRHDSTVARQMRGGFVGGIFFDTVISLIAAAFVKRPRVETTSEPPSLS
jgi:hypothetical protein